MPFPATRRAASVLAAVCLLWTGQMAGQDSSAVARPDSAAAAARADSSVTPAIEGAPVGPAAATPMVPDTLPLTRRPISPGGALLRSLLIPGWGQARMGRSLAAGFFLAVEGAALGMALKANSELDYMREIDSPSVSAKAQEREDWLVIVGVNHLIAGIEAYVSAYLWDFPGDLQMRPTPNGTAATISLPIRIP